MGSEVTSKHLQGVTDLTLVADVKPGLIPALDSVTFETRLGLVMRTLTGLRSSSREFAPIKPFSDTVERIQQIQSFRLAVIQPKPGEGVTKRLLLTVGFDGGWEPYIRRVYRDLGPLLDVMFCNTTDYRSSHQYSFQDYVAWIRSKQVDTGFFYNASAITVTDLQYLRQTERTLREGRDAVKTDLAIAGMTALDPETLAKAAWLLNKDEAIKLGLTALATLYRLTDYYPPDGYDGGYLVRATRELLKELPTKALPPAVREAYKAQIGWFEDAIPPEAPQNKPPLPPRPVFDASNVQGGILRSYDLPAEKVNHGCLLLMRIADGEVARAHDFLRELRKQVSSHAAAPGDGIYTNVAFTAQGLDRLGVPAAALGQFPKEFREGMEARADLLGDFRCNHPRNWALPRRNWEPSGPVERVQLSVVDIVVQLRARGRPLREGDHEIVGNPHHPLAARVKELADLADAHGVSLLSVEAMVTYRNGEGKPIGHLDFVDGISQPKVAGIAEDPEQSAVQATKAPPPWDDTVAMGEMLCGYENDAKDAPLGAAAAEYLNDGTFLVVRKLRLDTGALDRFFEQQTAEQGIPRQVLEEKMMGRRRDGTALADPPTKKNDFNYDNDKAGALCPFQSHARRANPRTGKDKPKVPRIMRRGMSYGPRGSDAAERGLMFLAYNASIAEQFETIQRWIAGGNSSGVFSGDADPFLGVPQLGDARTFRYHDGSTVTRVDLDAGQPHPGAVPFARLDWGAYLFVPSLSVLDKIAQQLPASPSDRVAQGELIIKTLLMLESKLPAQDIRDAWKAYLEDLGSKEKGYNIAIWAAIRAKFGGALWTPYGVLVASSDMVERVFANKAVYSVEGHAGPPLVEGYLHRSRVSIGEIYLGLDDKGPDSEYVRQSKETNQELMQLTGEEAFDLARAETLKELAKHVGRTVDLRTMLCDPVLAEVCRAWFDLPDGNRVVKGGWNWKAGHTPCCPGDFTAPSRYIFQPNPGEQVTQYAQVQGKALHDAVEDFIRDMKGKPLKGKIAKALFAIIPDDEKRLASTLIGVMMGFLPTVDGNFRSTLLQWMGPEGILWRLQAALVAAPGSTPYEKADATLRPALMQAMQKRPVPDIVWRTAKVKHDLGPVAVQPGDKIAIGIVSATQERLLGGKLDVSPVFGGERRKDGSGPTHACPAYHAGMGVLLGMISGLLEAGTLRATPVPLTLELS